MSHTRSCSQRFFDSLSSIRTYLVNFVSPLKPIAKAISEMQSVKDFRQGIGQITRVPELLLNSEKSEQTRVIVAHTFIANVPSFLSIAIMYQCILNQAYENTPRAFHNIISIANNAILLIFFSRLFIRRLFENFLYLLSLQRAMINDTNGYLIKTISSDFARVIGKTLSDIFSMTDISEELYRQLYGKMQNIFLKLFQQKNLLENPWVFNEAQKEMECEIYKIIDLLENTKISVNIASIAKLLSRAIIDELSNIIIPRSETATIGKPRDDLIRILSTKFMPKRTNELITTFFVGISKTLEHAKPFLPIQHIKSCECKFKKTIQASLASTLYFIGTNNVLKYISLLWGSIDSTEYKTLVSVACFLLRALLNGQNLNEARLSSVNLCTRHRYKMGARNKARLIGEGMIFLLLIESVKQIIYLLTNVDNAFTHYAIETLVLLLCLMPTYAFNEPLPGKKKEPFDIFYPIRKSIFWLLSSLKSWIFPILDDKTGQEECIKNIKNMLNSHWFSSIIFFIFGPSSFLPLYEIRLLMRENLIKKEIAKMLPESKSIDNAKKWEPTTRAEIEELLGNKKRHIAKALDETQGNKEDLKLAVDIMRLEAIKDFILEYDNIIKQKNPLDVLFANHAVRLFLNLHEKDIRHKVDFAKSARSILPWLVTPLSILPIQDVIISLIKTFIHVLDKKSLNEISRKIGQHYAETTYDSPIEAKYARPPTVSTLHLSAPIEADKKQLSVEDTKRLPSTATVTRLLTTVPSKPGAVIFTSAETKSPRRFTTEEQDMSDFKLNWPSSGMKVEEPSDDRKTAPTDSPDPLFAQSRDFSPKNTKANSGKHGLYGLSKQNIGKLIGLSSSSRDTSPSYELRSIK